MIKSFLKFFAVLLIFGLSARLLALEASVVEYTLADFDSIIAKVKDTVAHTREDGVLGPFFSSQVALPAEFLNGSPRALLLSRMQYAATLLYYQNELLTLLSRIDFVCATKKELESRINGASAVDDERDLYDDVVREVTAFGRRYNMAHGFLSDYLARFDTTHRSALLRDMILLKLHEIEVRWRNCQIIHLEDLVCDHYDAKQWKVLRGCIYPLLHLLEIDARDESNFDLRQEEWYRHAPQLLQQLVGRIDVIVRHDPSLQRYRANLWNPAITIVPKTVLSVDIDALVQEIEQAGSPEQSPRVVASSPRSKKKQKKRSLRKNESTLFIVTKPEELAEDAEVAWVNDEDFDSSSAFCLSAAGSPFGVDGTNDSSGRSSTLFGNTPSDVSAASSPDGGSAKTWAVAHYEYKSRLLIWHGADNAALHEHVRENCPYAFYFNAVAQHRVPFIIENQFVGLGRTEVRMLNDRAYRTLLFDGALIFGSGRRCLGTYEISRPVSKLDLVVHRFFKVDRACAWPDSLVLPERGECERCMMCNDHEYTVYENDQAVCIIENDSWLKVTHVIFKPGTS